ncbi:MAG: ABC transporter permease subunit [Thermoleophilaceae bacterium]|nr:ABC transporter permease subunit [Thermoleophilaceae bacterium]
MLRSVAGRALFEQRRAVLAWSLGTAAMVLVTVVYYPSVRDNPELNSFYESLPPAVQALSGGVGLDFASASGYLTGELFAITVPIIFIIYGVLLGAAAIGREEERGTAELLLTAPVTRSRVVAEKAVAAALLLAVVGAALFGSLVIGCALVDLEVSAGNLLASSLASVLLGITFGALALAISGALGHRAHPAAWAGSLAVAAYILYSLAPVVSSLETWQKLSAFYWYLSSDPVSNGFDAGHLAVLAGAGVALTALAALLFERRDVAS